MGVLFLVGGLALAGIPPTNGFVSKLILFRSGLETGAYLSLAGIAAAGVLTLVYIVRAFMRIWWEVPAEEPVRKAGGDGLLAPAVLVLAVIVLGLWPDPLLRLAQDVSGWITSPLPYIQAVLGGI
jgi:multicomponent Na+:H+ antiporter subunit D